jgi:hypothetical protein
VKKPKKSKPPLKKRPKFTEVLNQSIVESTFCKDVVEIYGPSATSEDADKHLLDLRIAKIPMLLDHYGIKCDDDGLWAKLSYALACEFVPGFQLARKRGRPSKPWWHDEILFDRVHDIAKERNRGISDAVRVARKRYPELRPYTAEGLEARYYETLKRAERVSAAAEAALRTSSRSSCHNDK